MQVQNRSKTGGTPFLTVFDTYRKMLKEWWATVGPSITENYFPDSGAAAWKGWQAVGPCRAPTPPTPKNVSESPERASGRHLGVGGAQVSTTYCTFHSGLEGVFHRHHPFQASPQSIFRSFRVLGCRNMSTTPARRHWRGLP